MENHKEYFNICPFKTRKIKPRKSRIYFGWDAQILKPGNQFAPASCLLIFFSSKPFITFSSSTIVSLGGIGNSYFYPAQRVNFFRYCFLIHAFFFSDSDVFLPKKTPYTLYIYIHCIKKGICKSRLNKDWNFEKENIRQKNLRITGRIFMRIPIYNLPCILFLYM